MGKAWCRTAAREGGHTPPSITQAGWGSRPLRLRSLGVGRSAIIKVTVPLCEHRSLVGAKHFPLSQNLLALSDPETWSASAPQAEVNWFRWRHGLTGTRTCLGFRRRLHKDSRAVSRPADTDSGPAPTWGQVHLPLQCGPNALSGGRAGLGRRGAACKSPAFLCFASVFYSEALAAETLALCFLRCPARQLGPPLGDTGHPRTAALHPRPLHLILLSTVSLCH